VPIGRKTLARPTVTASVPRKPVYCAGMEAAQDRSKKPAAGIGGSGPAIAVGDLTDFLRDRSLNRGVNPFLIDACRGPVRAPNVPDLLPQWQRIGREHLALAEEPGRACRAFQSPQLYSLAPFVIGTPLCARPRLTTWPSASLFESVGWLGILNGLGRTSRSTVAAGRLRCDAGDRPPREKIPRERATCVRWVFARGHAPRLPPPARSANRAFRGVAVWRLETGLPRRKPVAG